MNEQLIVSFLLLIESMLGYPPPQDMPPITRMPASELAERVCGAPCPVEAAFIAGEGILLDDALDIDGDAYAQSVLVHELVHVVQHANGTHAEMTPCRRHTVREYEAYAVQEEYLLRRTGNGLRGLHKGNRVWPRCFDD
ncbi:MAG: hypothetical protein QGF53_01005 [Alphaproteobacteria bacterium]|jgi:hypothetical protein|nr:hypothetical protein [Alphaproteobacteria bacterium]